MKFLTHKNTIVNHHAVTFIYLRKDCSMSLYWDSSKRLVVTRRKKEKEARRNARGERGGVRITIIKMQEIRSEED